MDLDKHREKEKENLHHPNIPVPSPTMYSAKIPSIFRRKSRQTALQSHPPLRETPQSQPTAPLTTEPMQHVPPTSDIREYDLLMASFRRRSRQTRAVQPVVLKKRREMRRPNIRLDRLPSTAYGTLTRNQQAACNLLRSLRGTRQVLNYLSQRGGRHTE